MPASCDTVLEVCASDDFSGVGPLDRPPNELLIELITYFSVYVFRPPPAARQSISLRPTRDRDELARMNVIQCNDMSGADASSLLCRLRNRSDMQNFDDLIPLRIPVFT